MVRSRVYKAKYYRQGLNQRRNHRRGAFIALKSLFSFAATFGGAPCSRLKNRPLALSLQQKVKKTILCFEFKFFAQAVPGGLYTIR